MLELFPIICSVSVQFKNALHLSPGYRNTGPLKGKNHTRREIKKKIFAPVPMCCILSSGVPVTVACCHSFNCCFRGGVSMDRLIPRLLETSSSYMLMIVASLFAFYLSVNFSPLDEYELCIMCSRADGSRSSLFLSVTCSFVCICTVSQDDRKSIEFIIN